ncbi:hypothetical protein HPULCUR_000461 [Helicostylum pulchrum]|uniref:Uncharacterized protein n=1 Tax=Helicostylum pulchrum TaxID=562976 RepID=A0ABP9XK05_9FUNG
MKVAESIEQQSVQCAKVDELEDNYGFKLEVDDDESSFREMEPVAEDAALISCRILIISILNEFHLFRESDYNLIFQYVIRFVQIVMIFHK